MSYELGLLLTKAVFCGKLETSKIFNVMHSQGMVKKNSVERYKLFAMQT